MRLAWLTVLALGACHRASTSPELALAAPVVRDAAVPVATPLVTLGGKRVSLAVYRRKVTFVAMWATFCGPCMEELPMIEALYQKKKDDPDVAIIAVSADEMASPADRAHVAEVAKKLGLTLPVLLDADHELAHRYALAYGEDAPDGGEPKLSLPTAVLMRADGRYTREIGFALGSKTDEFVSSHMATIDDAKQGTLAEEPKSEPETAPTGPSDTITIPAMSKADYAKSWPAMRAQLKILFAMSDAQLAAADKAARSGKPVTVHLPEKPATKQ